MIVTSICASLMNHSHEKERGDVLSLVYILNSMVAVEIAGCLGYLAVYKARDVTTRLAPYHRESEKHERGSYIL